MKERLTEVIKSIAKQPIMLEGLSEWADDIANDLVDYGAIMPPCKIGQICYKLWEGKILEVRVVSISYEPLPAFSYTIRFNSLGVLCLLEDGTRNEKYSWDIYLTRGEAEQALKDGRNNAK